MKTRTLKIEGHLTHERSTTFEYPLGAIESVTSGRWDIAISSISFFTNGQPWNSIYEVSTNYIDTITISATGSKIREEMPLALVRIKGQPNEKQVLGFKWRDYFEISSPSKLFRITFKEQFDPSAIPEPREEGSIYLSMLFILRRHE